MNQVDLPRRSINGPSIVKMQRPCPLIGLSAPTDKNKDSVAQPWLSNTVFIAVTPELTQEQRSTAVFSFRVVTRKLALALLTFGDSILRPPEALKLLGQQ